MRVEILVLLIHLHRTYQKTRTFINWFRRAYLAVL